ncbi:MAG TPA: ribose-phosphate pyrophosphokinase [Anaeromyxobacteraceae bacterium]|nr:ribose-phosphate pyrophosphokinase [Anaeromyxobacteraceae bacterium]
MSATHGNGYKLLAGNSNLALAKAVVQHLGRELSQVTVGTFSDGEIQVEIGENVRGCDTFLLQSTCPDANHNLMELLIMADALKRSSSASITAVIPYYGYARQDRKVASRAPITAKLVADLIEAAGVTRVVSMDMHAGQIQGFFNIPFDHLYAAPVMLEHMRRRFDGRTEDLVIVSPDAGGVERARAYSKRLGAGLGIVDKRRTKPNVAEIMNVIGDVSGKVAVLLDDLVDTAGTLTQAAVALKENGARQVFAYATHAVLSGPAVERIVKSPIEEMVVTDTIPLRGPAQACGKIQVVTVARLLAEAIRRIHSADSLSSLFV